MSHLPSLRALETLEAVVRTGNIVSAADDLCVTPGAVSKQLAQLQAAIEEPLFEKGHRLRPTLLATQLARAVGVGLQQIREGWEAAAQQGTNRVLTLAANATLSVHWIMPRLMDAQLAAGGPAIRVSALHTTDDWEHASFDIAIMRNDWRPTGWLERPIGVEQLTLLAPPGRAEALRRTGLPGLEAETIFVAQTRSGELERWLEAAGAVRPARVRPAPHFYMAAQAAVAGQGCVIGPPLVLSDLIDQGRLVAPFPDIITKGATLTATYNPERCKAAFVDALLEALFRDF